MEVKLPLNNHRFQDFMAQLYYFIVQVATIKNEHEFRSYMLDFLGNNVEEKTMTLLEKWYGERLDRDVAKGVQIGVQERLQEHRQQSMQQGMRKGMQQGAENCKQDMARKAISLGLSPAIIKQLTDYSDTELHKLAGKQTANENISD